MKKLIVFLSLMLATSVLADDGWKWKPEGTSSIRPVGDKVIAREYKMPTGGTLPKDQMFGTISNYGATGTVEITLQTPTGLREFVVKARTAQIIELDFPTDVNPYLNGSQVGANNEIDIPAGGSLLVEYSLDTDTWHCTMLWLVSADGNADD